VVAVQLVGASDVPDEVRELFAAASTSATLTEGLTRAGATLQEAQAVIRSAGAALPAERLLDPPSEAAQLAVPLSLAFATLFFFTLYLFGYAIAQSVVEEKQSRVVEILVAAVPIRLLLAGKVLGTTVLALGQLTLLVAVGLAGASIAGQPGLVSVIMRSGGWFLLFFLLGFLMLACLWAASGAVAGRQEDLQSTTVPLQVLVIGPFFAAVYVNSPGTPLTVLSFVPFTSPLAMPLRIMLGDAAWWEAVLAGGILVLTAVALVLLAARIYERSLLRTGSRTSWTAALGLGGPRSRGGRSARAARR
jgi:ABC-2 type transport system permease protein